MLLKKSIICSLYSVDITRKKQCLRVNHEHRFNGVLLKFNDKKNFLDKLFYNY
jgi:hypothetical protein